VSEQHESPEGVAGTGEPEDPTVASGAEGSSEVAASSPEVTGAGPLSPAPVPSGQVDPGAPPAMGPPAPWSLGQAMPPPPPPWHPEPVSPAVDETTADRSTDVDPDSGAADDPNASSRHERRGIRHAVLAGIAGGVVGALVAGGLFLVLDDDPATNTVGSTQVITRPSSEVARTGNIAAILAKDVPAVVAVVADGGPATGGGAGTGFVISEDGVIVTNNHVVEGASTIEARFSDGTSLAARVLGNDVGSDLAVLHVDAAGLPTIALGDSATVQVGDDVVAIGNALALEGGLSVTRGIVSGLDRTVPTSRSTALSGAIQTDAAINPGNSGGPLVDSQGRVIGINTAIADPSGAQNVGFAIPISQAKPIIDALRAGNRPAYLGVTIDTESTEAGAFVNNIGEGTPAARAGMRTGDVIVSIGDTPVRSWEQLRPAIREHKVGETVDVVVERDGEKVTLRVTLEEDPGTS
jgi:S1-C subfamily serine protease